jgi:hypothetical protein
VTLPLPLSGLNWSLALQKGPDERDCNETNSS